MATAADFLKPEGRMFGFPVRQVDESQGLGALPGLLPHPEDMMPSSQRILDGSQRMSGYSIDGILGHGRLKGWLLVFERCVGHCEMAAL